MSEYYIPLEANLRYRIHTLGVRSKTIEHEKRGRLGKKSKMGQ